MTKLKDYDINCYAAKLDMYCQELYVNKKLNKIAKQEINKIFKKYPILKDDFPALANIL